MALLSEKKFSKECVRVCVKVMTMIMLMTNSKSASRSLLKVPETKDQLFNDDKLAKTTAISECSGDPPDGKY